MSLADTHIRIPKPFEIGSLFSSLPETVANVMNGTEEGKIVMDWLVFTLHDVFAVDIIPQFLKPAIEAGTNENRFTRRKIVPEYMTDLERKEQYQPWTPEVLKELGSKLDLSPLQIQHLIRGYTGYLGAMIIDGADAILRQTGEYPDNPEPIIDDYSMGFVKRGSPARSTKYITRFYELYEDMNEAVKTFRHHVSMNEPDKAKEIFGRRKGEIESFGAAGVVRKQLSAISKRMKLIQISKTLSAKEKRDSLDKLQATRNNLVQNLFKKVKEASKGESK